MGIRGVIIGSVLLSVLVSGCASSSSPKVKAMQRKDKLLTCKEILLEMNEAEFYRATAQKNKGPSVKNMLMPLGYISTYMSAEEAIGAAEARVDYLDRIYQIMDCDAKEYRRRDHSIPMEVPDYAPAYPAEAPVAAPSAYYKPVPMAPSGGLDPYYDTMGAEALRLERGAVQYRHFPHVEERDEYPDGYVDFYPIGMYW